MLTRLQVSGFKNLVDVDVRFGPFTCIAGANGVGKSNLFDAITFLSALAEQPLTDAARSVRDESGKTADILSLFHRVGTVHDETMRFVAEMIVPHEGQDDLGQDARASITLLRYSLVLVYRANEAGIRRPGTLEIMREELVQINLGDAKSALQFPHSPAWRKSAVRGARRGSPFISTEEEADRRIIKLHQDGNQGRARSLLAATLPRTVVSATNAAESPTVVMAQQEMRSWRLLQLEPSALRIPDPFSAPTKLGPDGAHLPATLDRLAQWNASHYAGNGDADAGEAQLYAQVANRLSELIDDVYEVRVDRDQTRELLTLQVSGRDRTFHPAQALSDGTLRFLALAVLDLDPEAQGLICLEEPENGIHPERIPAILRLLQDLVTDTHLPLGPDNPLRQIVINTHSPAVVSQVPDDSLLVATLRETRDRDRRYRRVCFSPLPGTWRADTEDRCDTVAKGELLAYLNPIGLQAPAENGSPDIRGRSGDRRGPTKRRVIDRADLQLLLPLPPD